MSSRSSTDRPQGPLLRHSDVWRGTRAAVIVWLVLAGLWLASAIVDPLEDPAQQALAILACVAAGVVPLAAHVVLTRRADRTHDQVVARYDSMRRSTLEQSRQPPGGREARMRELRARGRRQALDRVRTQARLLARRGELTADDRRQVDAKADRLVALVDLDTRAIDLGGDRSTSLDAEIERLDHAVSRLRSALRARADAAADPEGDVDERLRRIAARRRELAEEIEGRLPERRPT